MTTPDRRRRLRAPSLVEFSVAAAIALAAIDEARLDADPSLLLFALRVVAAVAVIAAVAVDGGLRQLDRREPSMALLGGWLLWAAIASAGAFGGLAAITEAGLFALVAAGLAVAVVRGGSVALATVGIMAFAGYLAASVVLIGAGAVEAFNDDDRLMLASLEPNQLARAGAITVVCGLWLVIKSVPLWRWIGAATAVGACATIFASGSRTGLAALLVGVAVLAVHNSRRTLSFAGLSLLLGLTAAALMGAVGFGPSTVSIAERLESSPDGSASTLSGRDTLWPEIWSVSLDQPVTGHGLGTDRRLIAEHLDVGWGPQHAHNFPLHVLLTTGFVGVAVLAFAVGRGLWRSARQARPLEFALLLIVVVDGISEPVIRVPSFGWMALAGGLALLGRRRATTPTESGADLAREAHLTAV